MSETNTTYKLSDTTIAQVARVLQLAIITGTDIVDNLRLMRLTPDGEELCLDPDYEEQFTTNIQTMVDELNNNGQETAEQQETATFTE